MLWTSNGELKLARKKVLKCCGKFASLENICLESVSSALDFYKGFYHVCQETQKVSQSIERPTKDQCIWRISSLLKQDCSKNIQELCVKTQIVKVGHGCMFFFQFLQSKVITVTLSHFVFKVVFRFVFVLLMQDLVAFEGL